MYCSNQGVGICIPTFPFNTLEYSEMADRRINLRVAGLRHHYEQQQNRLNQGRLQQHEQHANVLRIRRPLQKRKLDLDAFRSNVKRLRTANKICEPTKPICDLQTSMTIMKNRTNYMQLMLTEVLKAKESFKHTTIHNLDDRVNDNLVEIMEELRVVIPKLRFDKDNVFEGMTSVSVDAHTIPMNLQEHSDISEAHYVGLVRGANMLKDEDVVNFEQAANLNPILWTDEQVTWMIGSCERISTILDQVEDELKGIDRFDTFALYRRQELLAGQALVTTAATLESCEEVLDVKDNYTEFSETISRFFGVDKDNCVLCLERRSVLRCDKNCYEGVVCSVCYGRFILTAYRSISKDEDDEKIPPQIVERLLNLSCHNQSCDGNYHEGTMIDCLSSDVIKEWIDFKVKMALKEKDDELRLKISNELKKKCSSTFEKRLYDMEYDVIEHKVPYSSSISTILMTCMQLFDI